MENQRSRQKINNIIKIIIAAVFITAVIVVLYFVLAKKDPPVHQLSENYDFMNCTVTNDVRYGILGENKTLSCPFFRTHKYEASVIWYYNDTKIDFLNNKKYSAHDGALVINNLSYNDEGQYNCTSTSKNNGFIKFQYKLIIKKSQKECSMPEIKQCSSVTKKINGSVIFNCDVIDNSTIFWYHNNTKIDIPSNEKYILLNDSIKINNLSIEDAGSYDCQTSDKFENKSISIYQLNIVKEAYKWISKSNYQSNLNGCGLLQICSNGDFNEFIGRQKYENNTFLRKISPPLNKHCDFINIHPIGSILEVLEVYGESTWKSINTSSAIIPSGAIKFGTIENQPSFVAIGAYENDITPVQVYYDEQKKCVRLKNGLCPSTLQVLVIV